MTDCPCLSQVAAYAEGDLPALQQEEMGAHVDGCPDCRAALEAQEAAVLALAELEAPGWSDAFVQDIVQAVHLEASLSTASETTIVPAQPVARATHVVLNALALLLLGVIVAWSCATPSSVAWTWTMPVWALTLARSLADGLLATVTGLAVLARLGLLLLPYVLLYVGTTVFLALALRGRSAPIPVVR